MIQQTKWMQRQTNPLQSPEDKLAWAIERLGWMKHMTEFSRGDSATFDVVLEEIDTLLSELQSGEMVDRGIE